MIVGLSLILGLTVAWALGAKLTRLADVSFRGGVLVFLALGLQVAIYTPLNSHVPHSWDTPVHGLSYLLLIGFFLLNMRVPGFWLVGFGLYQWLEPQGPRWWTTLVAHTHPHALPWGGASLPSFVAAFGLAVVARAIARRPILAGA